MAQLQSAVKNLRKLEQIKDYLKDNYINSTETHLDDLFDFYIKIENTRKQ